MTYAVIYTLPNFYETYPSIKVSSYEQEDISQDRLSRIANENSLKFKDIDDNNIYFESIDDQLNAYNKLKSNNKLNFTLIIIITFQVGYMPLTLNQSLLD